MKRENFAGAGGVLAVNSRMTKRVVLGVAAFLSLCLSLGAEQPARALSLGSIKFPCSAEQPLLAFSTDSF